MNEWPTFSVGELQERGALLVEDGNHGEYRPRREEFVDQGVAFIRAADMTSGTVDFASASKIDAAAVKRIRKGIGEPGDVLLSHKGTVGRVARAPLAAPQFICSPQTTFWRSTDATVLVQRFLQYVLESPDMQRQLSAAMHSTDMAAYVSLTAQRQLQVPLPPLPDQRAIAEVLGALDDKIAANRAVIDASDQLMGTEFSYACGPDADLRPLSDLARFVNGKAFTKNATGTGRVVIRIAELNGGIGGSTVWNDIDVPEENVAHPGDLLFAWSGSLTVNRWFRADAIVNQHIFKVIPKDGYPLWVVNGAVRAVLPHFQRVAANKATTMGHIQRRHLDEPVPVPAGRTLSRLDGLMSSLWIRALTAEMENERLAAARDALLPLLMSGKVRVKDVEDEVGELV